MSILRKIRKAITNPHLYIYDAQKKKHIKAVVSRIDIEKTERIGFVSQEMTYTGSPNSLLRMARVAAQKYQVIVFSLQDGEFKQEFIKNGIEVLVTPIKDLEKPYVVDIVMSCKFVIANTIGTSDFVNIYRDKLPIVWYIREAQNLKSYHAGRQKALKNFPFVCCVSEYAKEFIDSNYGVNAIVCHNAVEDVYKTSTASGPLKVLFSGTISARKGVDILVDAWSRIHEDYPTSELKLVGRVIDSFKEFYNTSIERLISNKKLNINYLGEVTDREAYFRLLSSVDIVIIPSRDESCSLVALEAAMMGKVVIVTENVGAKYICKEGAGYVAKTGDAEDLANILKEVLKKTRKDLEKEGAIARNNYLETSTFESYSSRFNELLDKIEIYALAYKQRPSVKKRATDAPGYNFVTYAELSRVIQGNINRFRKFDLIVGIPRSGMIPAYMIAFMLNKKVCSLNEFLEESFRTFGYRKIAEDKIKNVIILDDSMLSGRSINDAKELIREKRLEHKYKIEYGCIFGTKKNCKDIDICLSCLQPPRIFQWNYLNHPGCANWCYDIDGVLCEDPPENVNDDGEKYIEYIKKAPPLFTPKYELGAMVTSRLEKYREATSEWAKNNGIKFKYLAMLDLPDKKTRIQQKAHTRTKIEFYAKHKEFTLFLESDRKQAQQIAEATNKPVICVSTNEYFFFPKEEKSDLEGIFNMKGYCNICNTSFESFKEFGSMKRKVMCPNCKSIDRSRFLWFNICSEIVRLRGEALLYVGLSNTLPTIMNSYGCTVVSEKQIGCHTNKFKRIYSDEFILGDSVESAASVIEILREALGANGVAYILIKDKFDVHELSCPGFDKMVINSSFYPEEMKTKFNIRNRILVLTKTENF